MTTTNLTPQQAATRAKVSRGTIMNALKNGALLGYRDNRNRWQIKPEDLSKWLSYRPDNNTIRPDNLDMMKRYPDEESALRIAVLKAEVASKDQRISDLERDRDNWKEQAQELARNRPRRWWRF